MSMMPQSILKAIDRQADLERSTAKVVRDKDQLTRAANQRIKVVEAIEQGLARWTQIVRQFEQGLDK